MANPFSEYDDEIRAWANERRLSVHTEYKGDPVRSIQVVGETGSECQIWIDPTNGSVRAWDYDKRRVDLTDGTLRARLDAALEAALEWAGNPS